MIDGYFEDISPGDQIVSRARTITEADVINFAGVSGDWHPLHTDVEYAQRGPFGERIAHGMLVLSIATGLAPLDPETVLAFYGMDRLRFVHPARLGATIHVISKVRETVVRDEESGIVVNDVRIVDSAGEVLAAGLFRMLVKRRTVEGSPARRADEVAV